MFVDILSELHRMKYYVGFKFRNCLPSTETRCYKVVKLISECVRAVCSICSKYGSKKLLECLEIESASGRKQNQL